MQTHTLSPQSITHQQVIELIKTLPFERLGSLYDFALFLKVQPLAPLPEADIFGESDEEILADEMHWNEQFSASQEKLRVLAHEAAAEFRDRKTKPMKFNDEGHLMR